VALSPPEDRERRTLMLKSMLGEKAFDEVRDAGAPKAPDFAPPH
jgi:hypothetical protein